MGLVGYGDNTSRVGVRRRRPSTMVMVVVAATPIAALAAGVALQKARHKRSLHQDGNVVVIEHPRSWLCGSDSGTTTTVDRNSGSGVAVIEYPVPDVVGAHDEIEYSTDGSAIAYRRSVGGDLWDFNLRIEAGSRVYRGSDQGRKLSDAEADAMRQSSIEARLAHPLRRSAASRYLCGFVEEDWWWPNETSTR